MKIISVSLTIAASLSLIASIVFAAPDSATISHARKLLKLDSSISDSLFQQIANARSLGLPDNASPQQIDDAAWRKYANMRAKRYSWPANLSKIDLNRLEEKRKQIELCRSLNLPDTASDAEIEVATKKLNQQKSVLMDEYRQIIERKLPANQEDAANKKVMAKEKELNRPCTARLEGLPPTATWNQIEKAQHKNSLAMAARRLGISSDSSPELINSTREKQFSAEKIAMARKILKASPQISDSTVLATVQQLAKDLGYPKATDGHREFDALLTADDLFAGTVPIKLVAPGVTVN